METRCSLLGCSVSTEIYHVSCPDCLKVPDSDLYSSSYTDHKYCSGAHLLQDKELHRGECKERQLHRTIIRATALGNKVFAAWSRSMHQFRTVEEHFISPTRRQFVIEYLVDQPSHPRKSVTPEGIKAVKSFENCTFALIILAPLLSWALEGT